MVRGGPFGDMVRGRSFGDIFGVRTVGARTKIGSFGVTEAPAPIRE